MKIISMTATFGKLEHQTLNLEPGLNVIHAPNEWGKSTWCAFLIAMLYGIDTRERSKQGFLADKERYAPWSGSPMSGRIDLIWNDRAITIERSSRGRTPFGEFRAYETETGLPVPELTAADCGKTLLGVEKSVFTRAGFIRFSDMPVSEDEALRRRLNALVTTGDESGAGDALEQKLRDLRNRCRHNKTGQLPQAEAKRAALEAQLQQLQQLQLQTQQFTQQQSVLREDIRLLENHRDALAYAVAGEDAQRVEAANAACAQAEQAYLDLKARCDALPTKETAEEQILQLEQLRLQQEALQAQPLPTPPELPEAPAVFAGLTPEQAVQQATSDAAAYEMLCKPLSPLLQILVWVCSIAAVVLAFLFWPAAIAAGLLALVFLILFIRNKKLQTRDRNTILSKYPGLATQAWIATAREYRDAMASFEQQSAAYKAQSQERELRIRQLSANVEHFTLGASVSECLDGWRETLSTHERLATVYSTYIQAKKHAEAVGAMAKTATPPAFADTLTHDAYQTQQLLTQATAQQRQLELKLGQCRVQMDAVGQEAALRQQLDAVNLRISQLEDIYAATTIALQALADTANALQRKFAPRISQRAQSLFAQLTGGRYDRLTLAEDLRLHAAAQGEDILRPELWRSDGTADQLYLALRLAVAEELTPDAPLILDDALVRFDDDRMAAAISVLQSSAGQRQVILFSCQQREASYL